MQQRVTDADDPRLADYTRLTDVQLRTRLEPAHGLFIAEGTKVISRAVAAGYPVRSVLVAECRLGDLPVLPATGAPVYVVPDDIAERLTGYRIHRGALASLHRKPLPAAAALAATARRVIVLEDLVDHGNVGAIFRCAAALGVGAVILSPRCADPLYRRAVKVSMGAVFAIPYARMNGWHDGLADRSARPRRGSGPRCCSAPRAMGCPPGGGTRRIRRSASRCIPARWRPGSTRSTSSPPRRSRARCSAARTEGRSGK
jgi:tRNA G18 (ribose-2'-O)-methylase SpoU